MIENAEGNEELFHLHVKWIGRNSDDNKRRDVVACAAYRSGERLENTKKGTPSDFTHKAATRLYSEILTPEGSPEWARDRASLWNAVEAFEKRKDARLAIEFVAAFPYSVPEDKRADLLRAFLQRYVEDGYAVDFAIHLGEDGGNPHAHMMMTMRRFDGDTFSSQKERSLSQRGFVTDARKHWEETTNTVLAALGTGAYVDSRSLRERGIDRTPKRHHPPDRVTRAQKRKKFQREQEGRAMKYEPSRIERRVFPLLTQRADWHPEKMQAKPDMTPEELKELKQYHELNQPELEC